VDLDGDGHGDILSGSYSRMSQPMAGLFQVLWGRPDHTFKKAEVLSGTNGEPLIIPVKGSPGEGDDWIKNICTRPFAVDWDADGDLDLVVGNFFGTFYLFKGEGKGRFTPVPEEIKTRDESLKVQGHHSDPFVIDWDRDGDLDLLSGSSEGGVQWSQNRAGAGKVPVLEPFQPLIKAGPQMVFGQICREVDLKGPSSCTRVWIDDVNSDGKLDILVGDLVTLVSPTGDITEGEFTKKFAVWKKSFDEASAKLNAAGTGEKERIAAMEQFQKLYQSRTEFMEEDQTGFVWLYLQK
jgi:hypothetical protein